MYFIDTNIFLRYLTNDDPARAHKCLALFQKAKANQVTLTTSEAVIAEVVYLLSSKGVYNLTHKAVVARLRPLLNLARLKLVYRRMLLRALELYGTYEVDFEDCLSVAQMERQNIQTIYSYDHDFDQMTSIERFEP